MGLGQWWRQDGWTKTNYVETEPAIRLVDDGAKDSDGPIRRAERARHVLEDPIVQESLRAYERKAIDEFRVAKSDDDRRLCQAKVHAVTDLALYLRGVMAKGAQRTAEDQQNARLQRV